MSLTLLCTILGSLALGNIIVWHLQLRRSVARTPPVIPPPATYPSITVIRPVRGADVGAEQNFITALDTGYPGEVETFFVFDTEDDPGLPIARRVVDQHHALKRPGVAEIIVAGPPAKGWTGKLHAMDVGAARAKGELIAFGDSDTRPDHDVLRVAVEALLSRPKAGSAFAPVLVKEPPRAAGDVLYALMQNAMYSPMASFVSGARRSLPFIMGQLMVFRRPALAAIGGVGAAKGQLVDDMYIGKVLYEAGYENVMSAHPLHIETGGMTLREFLPVYRRWIMFSNNGLPLMFTWRQYLFGVDFFVALTALIVALASGAWLGAVVPFIAFLSVGLSLLALQVDYGGAKIPWSMAWVAWIFFPISPFILASNLLNHKVNWRGRDYSVDAGAALAEAAAPDATAAPIVVIDGKPAPDKSERA